MVKISKKKSKGGASQTLNIPKFILNNLGKETLQKKKAILEYDNSRKSEAQEILKANTSEYEKEAERLLKLKIQDDKLNEESRLRWERIMSSTKTTAAWFTTGAFLIGKWFLESLGKMSRELLVNLRYFMGIAYSFGKDFIVLVCSILDWVIRMLSKMGVPITTGPWARLLVLLVTIGIILGIIFGLVLPSITHSKNTDKDTSGAGANAGADANTGADDTGNVAEEKPTYSSNESDFLNDFNNMFKSPFNYFYKLIESIFPLHIVNSISSSYNNLTKNINIITGQPTKLDVSSTKRGEYFNGRSDNIYNIDIQLLSGKNIASISDIPPNNVYSLGKPKDIKWDYPEYDFKKSDYSLLPPSIKNIKDSNTNLSLEDKKELTIPWVTRRGFYNISCDDIYYTNSSNSVNLIKANILTDNIDTTNTCRFTLPDAIKIITDKHRKLTDENIDLSVYSD